MIATYRVEDTEYPTKEWREQSRLFPWEDMEDRRMTRYTMWLGNTYRGCTASLNHARAWCRDINGRKP